MAFISPVVVIIIYADSEVPNLGEIYETFDSMLEQIKNIIDKELHTFGDFYAK